MKNLRCSTTILLIILISLITNSCKKEKDNLFNDEAKKSYEAIISLQQESVNILAVFKTEMDSAAAVQALAQWFRDTSLVESAIVSSQGISVKYSGGTWGGILLDPKRYDETAIPGKSLKDYSTPTNKNRLKNLPTNKKAIFLPASISEFPNSNIRQDNNWSNSFNNLGYGYDNPIGSAVDLDYLAGLKEAGSILCLDSHGFAWPSDNQLSEVYFITGEEASLPSTEKYYQDILDHDIILLQFENGPTSTYAISPVFITRYNDFSKDTVLFYGGFCYSYLGTWPSLTDACASGTYFGFDWSVRSDKCADWAIDLVDYLADQNVQTPWNIEQWMSSSAIPKQYFDAMANKTVRILYNGNGALTLWKPDNQGNGTIISTAQDGAPITVPGFTCTPYVLQCLPLGNLPEHLSYSWDFGDGQTYYTVDDNLTLAYHWAQPQSYNVKVTISERYSGAFIMELNTAVSFVYPDFLPMLQAISNLSVDFGPDQAIILSNGSIINNGFFSFETAYYDVPFTWNGTSFSAGDVSNNDFDIITLEGNVSDDGKVLQHCLLKKTRSSEYPPEHELVLEISNLPLLVIDPLNCLYTFHSTTSGNSNQNYATQVEYKEWDSASSSWITISSINWPQTQLFVMFQ